MSLEGKFSEIKTEILNSSENYDSSDEIKASIFKSKSLSELMTVIKDNFVHVVWDKLITPELIIKYRTEFASGQIFCNEDICAGYLLCVDSTVKVNGNAFVIAKRESVVRAYGRCRIIAQDQTHVYAHEYTQVEAYGRTRVFAFGFSKVKATGTSAIKAYDNSIFTVCGSAVVWVTGECSVTASGESYVTSFEEVKCSLSENAIYRIKSLDRNEIRYASSEILIKQITPME